LSLLDHWNQLWGKSRAGFAQERTWERARQLALSGLLCMGRHTVTGALCTAGKQFSDWSADYRLFSQAGWSGDALFGAVREGVLLELPEQAPLLTALDDSYLKKTGTKIPGVKYVRDPMSPRFRPNFIRGQRYCQISALLPIGSQPGSARGIPLQFHPVPVPAKPKPTASEEVWKDYRRWCRQHSLAQQGASLITQLRHQMDEQGEEHRRLLSAVDGSYTNGVVIKALPERTTLIGRIRADAKLYFPPQPQSGVGRKRQYGERSPTPEQLRQDSSIPWQTVSVYAAGRLHDFQVKTLAPLLWRKAGAKRPLRLVVIRPLHYRLRKNGRLLYRQPGFLICTDPDLPVQSLLQSYVWRWEIEVNHRDQKQIIGVGQAQVRHPRSVDRAPALAVASYAFLLLAGHRAFDSDQLSQDWPLPQWRQKRKKPRLSTQDLINRLRHELWGVALSLDLPHFDSFANTPHWDAKSQKFQPSLGSTVLYALS
jgi:hypothetical protein